MNVIDEYLVKLGFSEDMAGYRRFVVALREVSNAVDFSATGMAGSFLKAQSAIVGAFVSIGGAALTMVDKVAMADQSYRLFALHMYMSKDAARSLKIAMDALGEPLENLTWDAELRDRMRQLIEDQRRMAVELGPDFDANMRRIRDIRFEFTRMGVELKYLTFLTVNDFFKALGMGPQDVLQRLRTFNDWVIHNLPMIAEWLTTRFMPIWRDVEEVAKSTLEAIKEGVILFTNLIGLLSGDRSIQGMSLDLNKTAIAIQRVIQGFADFASALASTEALISHLLIAITDLGTGNFKAAGEELKVAWQEDVNAKVGFGLIGGMAGAGIGSLVGHPAAGAVLGFGLGSAYGGAADRGTVPGPISMQTSRGLAQEALQLARQVSGQTGVPADLIWSQWALETGGFHNLAALNNLAGIKIAGTNTFRPFQTLNDFANTYASVLKEQRYAGIGSAKTAQDFVDILSRGHYFYEQGDLSDPHKMAALKAQYLANILHYDRAITTPGRYPEQGVNQVIGAVNIYVNSSNATPEQIKTAVSQGMKESQNQQVQKNLQEFQGFSWSY